MREAGFDCLVTCDKNLEWQQPIRSSGVAVVVLPFQRLAQLLPIVGSVADSIASARQGEVSQVVPPDRVP